MNSEKIGSVYVVPSNTRRQLDTTNPPGNGMLNCFIAGAKIGVIGAFIGVCWYSSIALGSMTYDQGLKTDL